MVDELRLDALLSLHPKNNEATTTVAKKATTQRAARRFAPLPMLKQDGPEGKSNNRRGNMAGKLRRYELGANPSDGIFGFSFHKGRPSFLRKPWTATHALRRNAGTVNTLLRRTSGPGMGGAAFI